MSQGEPVFIEGECIDVMTGEHATLCMCVCVCVCERERVNAIYIPTSENINSPIL